MNPEQLKNDAEAYEKKSLLILGVSFVLMILPVLVLIPLGREKALELLADLLITQGLLVGTLLFFSSMIPGLLFLILSKKYLEKKWNAKPETTCPHCQNLLLSANHFTAETGYCSQCGEKLMEVEPPEVTHPDLPVIPEEKKFEITEIKKLNSKKTRILHGFLGLLFVLLLSSNYLVTSIYPPSEDRSLIVGVSMFSFVFFMFAGIYFIENYLRKKYPLNCPECNKDLEYVPKENYGLIQTRRCPHCEAKIVKKPETEVEPEEIRSLSPKELILVSHHYRKFQSISGYIVLVAIAVIVLPVFYWMDQITDVVPDWLFIFMILIIALAMPVSVILSKKLFMKRYFDQKNLNCWNCGKFLLLFLIKETVQSGNCYSCGQKVLEED